jgi:hypothetical protein
MTLTELIKTLTLEAKKLQAQGLSADNVRVVIHHSNGECTGDIYDVTGYHNIQMDDIPYDINGRDIDGTDTIKVHDDVIVITGDY